MTSWINDRVPSQRPWDDYKTYDVGFNAAITVTTVTSDPEKVSEWIREMEQLMHGSRTIVSLDVKWRPAGDLNPPGPVCVLVLCVDFRCLIFQIMTCLYIPQSLANYLSNRSYTFVGVGIREKLEKLNNDCRIGGSVEFKDLAMAASEFYRRVEMGIWELKELARFVLKIEIDEPQFDVYFWDSVWLKLEQVRHATVNAKASYDIGKIIFS